MRHSREHSRQSKCCVRTVSHTSSSAQQNTHVIYCMYDSSVNELFSSQCGICITATPPAVFLIFTSVLHCVCSFEMCDYPLLLSFLILFIYLFVHFFCTCHLDLQPPRALTIEFLSFPSPSSSQHSVYHKEWRRGERDGGGMGMWMWRREGKKA